MFDVPNIILDEIGSFLRKTNSVFFTFAQDMMVPEFSDTIPTACVMFTPDDGEKCIRFLVNQDFWNKLNYNEKIFIFIHETLHVLFSHGKRGNDFLKTLPKKSQSHKLLNICMDICINEIIMDQYLSDIPLETMPEIQNGCFIHTVFEDNIASIDKGKSFEYYYQKFLDLYGQDAVDELNLLTDVHTFMDYDAETLEKIEQLMEDAFFGNGDSDELKEDKIINTSGGYSIGSFSDNNKTVSQDIEKQPDSLEKHLKLMISSSFEKNRPKVKNQWYGVNRRTHKVLNNTGMFLPVKKEINKGRKYKILVYSDISGSCKSVSKRFLSLVAGLDKNKYDTDLYVFADSVKECKINDNKVSMPFAGWGTQISAVLYHYRYQKSTNYDAVLVLTDGWYSNLTHINDDEYKNWHFFIIQNGIENKPIKSKSYKI